MSQRKIDPEKALRRKYFLDQSKDCDAAKYGLYHGKDFDRWFLDQYVPNYEETFEE